MRGFQVERAEKFIWIDEVRSLKLEIRNAPRNRHGRTRFCTVSLRRQRILIGGIASAVCSSQLYRLVRASPTRIFSGRLNAKRPKRIWWKKLLSDEVDWWKDHNSDEDAVDETMADEEEIKSIYRKIRRDPNSEGWEDWLDDSWDINRNRNRNRNDPDESFQRSEVDEIEQELRKQREEELKFLRAELDSFGKSKGPFSFTDLFQEPLEWHQENRFERGFARTAAKSTVKFVACLILVPWFADFVVHECVLVPFLKRYVEVVPLAAKVFDVTDSQKLKRVIPPLKDEETRLTFEAEIGIAPPISEEELRHHLHDEALELLEEVRAENRSNFANVWSDMVAGATLLTLLLCNPVQVELMSYSGIRLFSNLSDIGKAFFIILFSDIFLGYHSESGWVTVVELFLEHYGMKANEASVSSFVAIVPVTIDACFKLWVFRNLPRLSPSLTAIFREMERH